MSISRSGDIVRINQPSYRLQNLDNQKTLQFAAACVVSIPSGLSLLLAAVLEQMGSGAVSVVADGVALTGDLATTAEGGKLKLLQQTRDAWKGTSVVEGGGSLPFAPGAPTIGTATAGNGTVTVPFTAPASVGASPILDYQALLVDGTTKTVSASPATFTGKVNGTPYVGAVRARNTQGYGPYSAQSNSVTPVAPAGALRQIAGQVRLPNTPFGTAAIRIQNRTRHRVGASAPYVRLAFPNKYINNGQLEVDGAGVMTVSGYVVRGGTNSGGAIVGGTIIGQMTWGGATSVDVPAGQRSPLCDPLYAPWVEGDVVWAQSYVYCPQGVCAESPDTQSAALSFLDNTNGELFRFSAGALVDNTASMGVWTGGTNNPYNRYGPCLIVGEHTGKAVYIEKTSIAAGAIAGAQGTPPAPAAAGEIGDKGFIARCIGASVAYIQGAQPSSRMSTWLAGNNTLRLELSTFCTHVITDFPYNDALAGTTGQALADLCTQFAASFGGKPVYICTGTPYTTGAWTLADGSDQTYHSSRPVLNAFNVTIRNGIPGYAGWFEVHDAVVNTNDPSKWHSNGTAGLMTTDGLHMTTFAEQRVRAYGGINVAALA